METEWFCEMLERFTILVAFINEIDSVHGRGEQLYLFLNK